MRYLAPQLIMVAFLAGCATTARYQNYLGQDGACVKGHSAGFFDYVSEKESMVSIDAVDGVPTGGGAIYGPYCFPSGKHSLGISTSSRNTFSKLHLELQFDPGKKYELRSDLRGISFILKFVDISTSPEVMIAEYRVKVSGSEVPSFPIIIPAR